ncbi:hypothetical protein [Mycobacterium sp. 94-17]|uniref:hypothetical protein n=1 Tax=Mycobacterium sp. 94-17 TaxID=2986147 RepID=UPI002D1F3625|nr:hypothetical protein [Mycobacterium sp. 94-17]MEB4210360.1 hypothetical protein [Mycobacterium sp. 94-17]
MSRSRSLVLAVAAAAVAIASAVEGRADSPTPGDECTVLHAIARDVNDRPMWCNPTTTGPHTLVWQHGGPA